VTSPFASHANAKAIGASRHHPSAIDTPPTPTAPAAGVILTRRQQPHNSQLRRTHRHATDCGDRHPIFAITCPYHSDRQWRELRDRSPSEWEDAVAFDRAIRRGHPAAIHKAALRGKAFLHPSLRPLDQVDLFPSDADAAEADGFGNDCQGVCGV
jgi:hypothetical protein